MNLLDLLKLPAADTPLAALPVLPGALPATAPLLPGFADALAQLQPAAAPQAPVPAGQTGDLAAAPLPVLVDLGAQPSSADTLPALPPEGLACLASAAPVLPVAAAPQADVEADRAEPSSDATVMALPMPMPPAPAPTDALAAVAEPAALPRVEASEAPVLASAAVPAWQALPQAPVTVAAAPQRRAQGAALPPEVASAAAPRDATEPTEPTRPTQLEGWLAAQATEAEPVPAAPLQTALRLPEPQATAEPGKAWRQPLLVALGDRLQLQIAARSEQAVIRLEPPLLGRIDIAIRHEGGELQVRLAASHAEVGRQLQQITEPLRQDLLQRHSGEVSVQVSTPAEAPRGGSDAQAGGRGATAQQQQQQQQHQERRPGRGLAEEGETGGFAAPR